MNCERYSVNKRMRLVVLIMTVAAASLTFAGAPKPLPTSPQTSDEWWQDGRAVVQAHLAQQENNQPGAARNVILFLGDGMSIATVTAARILAGQLAGGSGEEFQLSFEGFPATALSKTYNTNQQTPDSAGTMSAIVTGVKTKAGILGLGPAAERGNCADVAANQLPSLLDWAEQATMSTGIVTTARLTHATPAALYAKSPEREWEDDTLVSKEARAAGCHDNAAQLLAFSVGNGIEVALGGGRRHFLPKPQGSRADRRNLIEEWRKHSPQGVFVENRKQLAAVKAAKTPKLFGLFNDSHMLYEAERNDNPGDEGEPSLAEMTTTAIDILQQNSHGFFLMVEAGRIDHANHAGIAYHALHDTIALSDAVAAAMKKVNLNDTLIVVTADHSHVLTMAGYPTRGNPILGYVVGNDEHGAPSQTVDLAGDAQPYTTLGYHNGPGAGPRMLAADTKLPDSMAPDYHQQAAVPMFSETHGGDDVAVYAIGPGSHLFSGVIEQNVIFHLIDHAAALTAPANRLPQSTQAPHQLSQELNAAVWRVGLSVKTALLHIFKE